MFEFGKNWASFSRQLDDTRIAEAVASLNSLFGEGALKGRSFLDIGCGSGLFSVAAARLGAFPVVGIDVDPVSVQVSCENAQRWLEGAIQPTFRHASALDDAAMQSLGTFDIVYSWGVLHHTGDMKHALAGAARAVKPDGSLMIAIYNRHWSSGMWKVIKWAYNHAGRFGQKLLIWLMTPVIFAAKWMVTRRNPLSMRRGMDFMHNIVDWVGGYPYDYASAAEMEAMLEELGLRVENVRRAVVPTACNEFVCRRAS